jgi:DNA repair photolyase
VPKLLVMSGVTDPYQPIERKLQLTRRCLEVLAEFRNPVSIITKNALVARDADILGEMAKYNGASVNLSVTSLDPDLTRIMEPRTSTPQLRLDAISKLAAAGIPVNVMVAPVVPAINEHEILPIIAATSAAGATHAGFVVLRLPWAVAPLFERWLEEHFPDRKEKVLNRVRDMRGGKMYDSTYGVRQRGEGIFAQQIKAVFDLACRKYGMNEKHYDLSTAEFRRPTNQGSLF